MTNPTEVSQSDIDLFISLWEPDEALVDDIQAGRAFTGEIKEIARHRIEAEQRGRLAGMAEAAGIAEAYSKARYTAKDNALTRKKKLEARDHESMAIEGIHIAVAIRNAF